MRQYLMICVSLLGCLLPLQGNELHEASVVLIECTSQRWNFKEPWKPHRFRKGSGTGFVIQGNRILTNAHVVANARYIEITRIGDDQKYVALVKFAAHDCDLAILEVEDSSFFEGMEALEMAPLPKVNSVVTTHGFPMGGTHLSVTRGVVSRIQMRGYSHSGADSHLVVQTDSAINPGNSGGPVIQDGKVVGVAFQVLREADNIGYLIPSTVVEHVLEDVEDGRLDGFGEMGVQYRYDLQNPIIRSLLEVPEGRGGVLITRAFPRMPSYGKIQPLDVLMSINTYEISDDGKVKIDGRDLSYAEVMEREQIGTAVHVEVWREGKLVKLDLPLKEWNMIIDHRRPHDKIPKYVIWGGLCFTPLSRGYLDELGGVKKAPLTVRHAYEDVYGNEDLRADELVVLSTRLPHEINQGSDKVIGLILESVDGEEVLSLSDLRKKLADAKGPYAKLSFKGKDIPYVMKVAEATAKNDEILAQYRVPSGGRE
jgi:S1-C subfamily serine protease